MQGFVCPSFMMRYQGVDWLMTLKFACSLFERPHMVLFMEKHMLANFQNCFSIVSNVDEFVSVVTWVITDNLKKLWEFKSAHSSKLYLFCGSHASLAIIVRVRSTCWQSPFISDVCCPGLHSLAIGFFQVKQIIWILCCYLIILQSWLTFYKITFSLCIYGLL